MFLILAALAMAGCASPGSQVEPAGDGASGSPAAVASVLDFAAPVEFDASTYSTEPTIAAGPNGTVFVSAPSILRGTTLRTAGMQPQSQLWVSRDHGETFDLIGEGPFGSKGDYSAGGDSDIAVDVAGRVWFADLGQGVPVLTSTDGATTWTMTPSATEATTVDRPWILAGGLDQAFLFYAWNGDGPNFLEMVATTDGGATWTPATRISQLVSPEGVHGVPSRDVDRGTLYVPFTERGRMLVAISDDSGASFDTLVVADGLASTPATIFPTSATDRAGNVYVAWSERAAFGHVISYAWSTPGGRNWSSPIQISYEIGNDIMPALVAGDAGKIAIAYYESSPIPGGAARPDASYTGLWYVSVAHSLNALDEFPVFNHTRAVPTPIHVGTVCTTGTACLVGTAFAAENPIADRTLGDLLDVALLSDGRLAVAYAHDNPTPLLMTSAVAVVVQSGGDLLLTPPEG